MNFGRKWNKPYFSMDFVAAEELVGGVNKASSLYQF
jgi:hypothetical protein